MQPFIILVGASGFIGLEYVKYFIKNNIPYITFSRITLNSPDQLFYNLQLHKKYNNQIFLINAAGYTGKPNVDACEDNKAECLYVNSVLPGKLNDLCSSLGIIYCHVSSGCIYNGYDKVFTEEDAPNFTFRQNNCSFYSGTKALGEEIISDNPNKYVWRLRIPFNSDLSNPRNYLSKIIKYPTLLNTANSITYIDDFIDITYKTILQKCPFGIYNITNDGEVHACKLYDILMKNGLISAQKQYYKSIEEFSKTVSSPRSNCLLDNSKIKNLGFKMENAYNIIERII